jgi:hypothetical protein
MIKHVSFCFLNNRGQKNHTPGAGPWSRGNISRDLLRHGLVIPQRPPNTRRPGVQMVQEA